MKKLLFLLCSATIPMNAFAISPKDRYENKHFIRQGRHAIRKPGKAPELDPKASGASLVLLAGGLMLLSEKRKKSF